MKNAFLLLLFCFITKVCDAQEKPLVLLNNKYKDTNNYQPNGSMPNALKKNDPNLKMKLKGNNQQGFDVYESNLDRMTILIPDSANNASLGISTPKQKQNQRLILKNNPPSQQYQDIPLTRPFDDSLLIPDFNMKPYKPKKEHPKKTLY